MNDSREKRFAVLIDSDNVSPKYIKYILDEISTYGSITYKRIYGDWTCSVKTRWKSIALENSIMPIQQYGYTVGKNATDSAMIIDAMDILYSNHVEGFCIVSSDSDFTRLAARLRESGMTVIGMGEEKTPQPFRASCNVFKKLENLIDEDVGESVEPDTERQTTLLQQKTQNRRTVKQPLSPDRDTTSIERIISNIITESGRDDAGMYASEIKACLVNRFSDFDVKDYGYSKFSRFLNSFPTLELLEDGTKVRLRQNETAFADAQAIVVGLVRSAGGSMFITELNNKLQKLYPQLNLRAYGYSKLKKFLTDIPLIHINSKNEVVYNNGTSNNNGKDEAE
jgi:uncharacterized LabA/DUF88 family protein